MSQYIHYIFNFILYSTYTLGCCVELIEKVNGGGGETRQIFAQSNACLQSHYENIYSKNEAKKYTIMSRWHHH